MQSKELEVKMQFPKFASDREYTLTSSKKEATDFSMQHQSKKGNNFSKRLLKESEKRSMVFKCEIWDIVMREVYVIRVLRLQQISMGSTVKHLQNIADK